MSAGKSDGNARQYANKRLCVSVCIINTANYVYVVAQRALETNLAICVMCVIGCLFQRQLNVRGYQCTKDLKYVLFEHNVKQVSAKSHP